MSPHGRSDSATPMHSRAERARQYLTTGAVARDDSDDELGLVDHAWEWIYDGDQDGISNEVDQEALESQNGVQTPVRKRKNLKTKRFIRGARMGSFQCRIGDTVLLKSPEAGKAWVAVILHFLEDEEEGKAANFMWFCSESEIAEKHRRKRTDALPQELYITPSYDVNSLASINGKATVYSKEDFNEKFPNGPSFTKKRKLRKEYTKSFICRRACNIRTVRYSDEFSWDEYFPKKGDEDVNPSELLEFTDRVLQETKLTRKRRADTEYVENQEEDKEPSTPRKRQKTTSATSTPRSVTKRKILSTPTHKRIIVKKALEITPLGTRLLSPSALSSPFSQARNTLHVAAVPICLPCRENEFSTVYSHLSAAIADGTGACIYISGVPGTGKTATVREVISSLNASVQSDELEDFIFVEINGMKVTDPHQAYSLLWEALRRDRVAPSHALDLLQREFSTPSPRRVPCVVLMDELDQLVTRNQSVMYNFFNWPALRHSRLIVLAVANTMDLPERTLSNKISSRLGLTRITFPGYNFTQLQAIISSRLENIPGNIVDPDAIQFAARKVAAVSGDARRCLDICRRAVEIAEQQSLDCDAESLPNTPSKRKSSHPESNQEGPSKPVKVTIQTIKLAISESVTSPLAVHLRSLPLSQKLFLAALLARSRRTGLAECTIGDVLDEARNIALLADNPNVKSFLLDTRTGRGRMNSTTAAPRVAALGNAATQLMEAGVVVLEIRRGERVGRVRLGVSDGDVTSALGNDGESKGMGFSS